MSLSVKRNCVIAVVVAICLVCVGAYLYLNRGPVKYVFEPGDNMEKINVYDTSGTKMTIKDVAQNHSIFLYVRSTCPDCIGQYDNYSKLVSRDKDDKICFIWDGEIPIDTMREHGIDTAAMYTTREAVDLTTWVPTYFGITRQAEVVFKSIEIADLFTYVNVPYEGEV